jgi:ribonuclease G
LSKNLFVNANKNTIKVALLDGNSLLEYHEFPRDNVLSVGDIYLAKVKKTVPSLNAAFVNINADKEAYLPYIELGPNFNSLNKIMRMGTSGFKLQDRLSKFKKEELLEKEGKITTVLKKGQDVILQISKEPISNKGAKATSEISFAGRFLVLLPFAFKVNISKKIGNPETKKRLRNLVREIKPKNMGMIIRTVAEDATDEELTHDLNSLLTKWDTFYSNLKAAKSPKKLLSEDNRLRSLMRDMINDTYQQITINDESIYNDLKDYFKAISPSMAGLMKHYNGKKEIFEHFGVLKAIKVSFGKTVSVANGAYLVIEHTEALHVIDVNSGRAKATDKTREENILSINEESAKEVARQLRLRDMGGIIVVDFIDLKAPKDRKHILEVMKEAMSTDRAKHTILPMTKFGLMQITRERVRPEVVISTTETCVTCNG